MLQAGDRAPEQKGTPLDPRKPSAHGLETTPVRELASEMYNNFVLFFVCCVCVFEQKMFHREIAPTLGPKWTGSSEIARRYRAKYGERQANDG